MAPQTERIDRRLIVFFLFLGIIFRLIWPADMVWLGDEQYLWNASVKVNQGEARPSLGMPSSQQTPNPALSVWLFILIGKIAKDPVQMVQAVQLANVLALLVFYWLFQTKPPKKERMVWLWGLAIFAVSALPVLYSRKIWQQCLWLPFFCFFLWSFWERRKLCGAFFWGVLAAILPQIHMGGFFLLPWWPIKAYFDDKKENQKTQWWAAVLGFVLGGIPLIQWALSLSHDPASSSRRYFTTLFRFQFLTRWLEENFGLGLRFILRDSFRDNFFYSPLVLPLAFLLVSGVFGIYLTLKRKPKAETALNSFLVIAFWGYGGSLWLGGFRFYPHYWILVYPFPQLWVAQVFKSRRKMLIGIAVANALLTGGFLRFIHLSGGVLHSEFGMTYRSQVEQHEAQTSNQGRESEKR